MGKLSKQVLVLGLASGVLLSGLPLGNVADASSTVVSKSKTSKDAKAKASEAALKSRVKKLSVEYNKLSEDYMNELLKVEVAYKKTRTDLDMMRYRYSFDQFDVMREKLEFENDRVGEELKTVVDKATAYGTYYPQSKDLKSVEKNYKRLIPSMQFLKRSSFLTDLKKDVSEHAKNVSNLNSIGKNLSADNRKMYESKGNPDLVVKNLNEKWLKEYSVVAVSKKYVTDLVARGYSKATAETLARSLEGTLTYELKGIKNRISKDTRNYNESFGRDISDVSHGNVSGVKLAKLNKTYLEVRKGLDDVVNEFYNLPGGK